jgi:hypothetical protein
MNAGRPYARPPCGRTLSRRSRRASPWSLGVLAVLALAGCTAGGTTDASPAVPATGLATAPATGPATALPAGVTAELQQLRSDVAGRQAQVRVTNGTDGTLTVGAIEVDDPRFVSPAERVHDRESRIAAGATVSIPVQLAPVKCPAPDEATASVTIDWSTPDASGTATAELPDPLSFVPPLHDRECRAVALAAAADVVLSSFTPSAAGSPADLTLTIAPTGQAAATVAGIHTTNLLSWASSSGQVHPIAAQVREGDTEAIEIHLPLVPLRCDAHAVQEDKRGTVFTLDVQVDGDPGMIELAATEEMRGRILTWVGQWCGFGG